MSLMEESIAESPRSHILATIRANPGFSKTEISNLAGLSWNLCDYHVVRLCKSGEVRSYCSGRDVHLFPSSWSPDEFRRIVLKRQLVPARILQELTIDNCATITEMQTRLGNSRACLVRALRSLADEGLVVYEDRHWRLPASSTTVGAKLPRPA